MKKKQFDSTQEWLPFTCIRDDGIIKLKENSFVKILKISPINFNLKSELEKEAILYSYKNFLKSFDFDIQIIIQSKKEDLSSNLIPIEKNIKKENYIISKLSQEYIAFLKELNSEKKYSSKNFYIILKEQNQENQEKTKIQALNDQALKVKDFLSKCGNSIFEINTKQEIQELLKLFLNGM